MIKNSKAASDAKQVMYLYKSLVSLRMAIEYTDAWGAFEYGTEPCPMCGEQSDVLQWRIGTRRAGICPNCGEVFTD